MFDQVKHDSLELSELETDKQIDRMLIPGFFKAYNSLSIKSNLTQLLNSALLSLARSNYTHLAKACLLVKSAFLAVSNCYVGVTKFIIATELFWFTLL
jgi:hypothetical protein